MELHINKQSLKNNYYYFKIIVLIIFSNVFLVNSQNKYPLSGQILLIRDTTIGSGVFVYTINVKVVFNINDNYPSTIKLKSVYDTITLDIKKFEINCDSTNTVNYQGKIDVTFQGSEYRFIGSPNMFFSGINTNQSYPFTFYGRAETLLGGTSPEIISNVIDLRSDEQFSGGVYKYGIQNGDSIVFMPFRTPDNGFLFLKSDTNVYVNHAHGIISMKAPHLQGIYQYSPEIKFEDGHIIEQPIISFRVDSNVKSHFVVNPTSKDSHGQSGIKLNSPGIAHFSFCFVDPGAQNVELEWYTTLDRFEKNIQPTIIKKQSGDSTYIDFDVAISERLFANLPGAFNFLLKSSKSGRPCQNRLFSFYVESNSQLGLTEKSHNNSILIYPNPVDDKLIISNAPDCSFSISDIIGRQLLTTNDNEIDMSHFNSGLYLISITNQNGNEIKTTKIIKN